VIDPVTTAIGLAIVVVFIVMVVSLRAAAKLSPTQIRQSAISVTRAQFEKIGVDWKTVDPAIAEAIVIDAIVFATHRGNVDLVRMDEHIHTLVRLSAKAARGLLQGGVEERLWRRVTERAADLSHSGATFS
jgi:hypothetical protein